MHTLKISVTDEVYVEVLKALAAFKQKIKIEEEASVSKPRKQKKTSKDLSSLKRHSLSDLDLFEKKLESILQQTNTNDNPI